MNELLIKKAKRGDKKSFTKLILEIKNQSYKIAYCYLHNEEDSMDAVCNAVEKAYKNIKSLKNPEYFKTWFIRIVINECKAELRYREKTDSIKQQLRGREFTLTTHDDGIGIYNLLQDIPESERTMIHMKYYMGYTLQEISEIMDIPIGTAKTKIYSNIKKLKSMFENKEVSNYG